MGRSALQVGIATKSVVSVLQNEIARRGVSRTSVTASAGIGTNRSGIIFRLESPITVEETRVICEALGITVASVLREAEAMWTQNEPADVIDFPHTQEENLPDFTKLAARKVTTRPEWEARRALNEIGEESQDPGDYED